MQQQHHRDMVDNQPFDWFDLPPHIANAIHPFDELHDNVSCYRPISVENVLPEEANYCRTFVPAAHPNWDPLDQNAPVVYELTYSPWFDSLFFHHPVYVLRPTKLYLEYLIEQEQQQMRPPAMPDLSDIPLIIATNKPEPKPKRYNLTLRYLNNNGTKTTPFKYTYYQAKIADGATLIGQLNVHGEDYLPNLPKGDVSVTYGLTAKDASLPSKEPIQQQHDHYVQQLQQTLDAIIEKTKAHTAAQNAKLKHLGTFGKGYFYTKAFIEGIGKGIWQDGKDLVRGSEVVLKSAVKIAEDPAYIFQIAKDAGVLSGEAINMLEQLHKHPVILEMLAKFVYHYVGASSIEDYGHMIGEVIPYIVLALFGGAVGLIADDTAIAGLIAKLASKEGTIARLEVYAKVEGGVEKSDNVLILEKEASRLERPKGIPSNWIEKSTDPNKKYPGKEYVNPADHRDRVRVMPGNPNHPNINSRKPYIKRTKDGKWFDKNGKPVLNKSSESHIPYEDFVFRDEG